MHDLPVDEDFVQTAKARAVAEREMAVSAEQLFAALEDGPSWSKWVPVAATNIGWVSALAEEYRIVPLSDQRCTLRWTFAVSFPGVLGKIEPLVGRVLPAIQPRLLGKLERVAAVGAPA